MIDLGAQLERAEREIHEAKVTLAELETKLAVAPPDAQATLEARADWQRKELAQLRSKEVLIFESLRSPRGALQGLTLYRSRHCVLYLS
jgi:hypothetical protein